MHRQPVQLTLMLQVAKCVHHEVTSSFMVPAKSTLVS